MARMSIADFIRSFQERYKGVSQIQQRSPRRVYIRIPRENLKDAAHVLFREMGAKFSIATGIDVRDGFEVLYHFTFNRHGFICTLRTLAPRDDPKLDSLTSIIPGTIWIEREIHDILGVTFEGHPNLKRLVKAEFLQDDEFPFRRDFDIRKFKEKHGLPIPD